MKKPISVKDVMTTAMVTFSEDMELIQASRLLVDHEISGAPVVNEQGHLVGILTERDCFKPTVDARYHDELAGKVREFMTRDVVSVNPDMSVMDLATLFLKNKYRRYPVVSEKKLVGLISRRDVLQSLLHLSGIGKRK